MIVTLFEKPNQSWSDNTILKNTVLMTIYFMTAVYFTNNRNKVIQSFHSDKNDVTLEAAYGNLQ